MKTETAMIVGALAIAAGLVLIPKRPRSASGVAAAQLPSVGTGDASNVWDDRATARYREQLRRQAAADPGWTGP